MFSTRLSVVAALAIAGLALMAAPATGAAFTTHGRAPAADAAATVRTLPAPSRATASGTRLWLARFGGTHKLAFGDAVAASPAGSAVFVTGQAATTKKFSHGVTLAYNSATGAVLWRTSYDPVRGVATHFSGIAVSPDGSTVFVTGEIARGLGKHGQSHFLTAAYDAASGDLIWSQTWGSAGTTTTITSSSIALSPGGSTVFVTGASDTTGRPTTVAYIAQTGAVLWTQHAGGGSVAASTDGSAVFVTGSIAVGTPGIVAYNAATGATLWVARASVTPRALAVSPDGSKVFITGWGLSSLAIGTQAFDATTGASLWTHTGTGTFTPSTLAVSPDSSTVYVTGFVSKLKHSTIGKSYGTQAYDASTGATLWTATWRPRVQSPGGGGAESAAVSPDGSTLFITGVLPGPHDTGDGGYGTVAYDASTGARLWTATHRGVGAAHSLAVSPDGSTVFVTGDVQTAGATTKQTIVTIAYSS